MRAKDIINFTVERLFNRTISLRKKPVISKVDYLKQVNRLNTNIESASIRYLFDRYKFDCVLDVGANRGQYYDSIRKDTDYKGTIISIEPSPRDYEYLKAKGLADKNFFAYNFACGEKSGNAVLNITEDTKLNSFYLKNSYSETRFAEKIAYKESIEVGIKTLDEVLDAAKFSTKSPRIFLKVDTQGHDVQVIKGLTRWSSNVFAIQAELSLIPIYQDTPSYGEMISFLDDLGYTLFSCTPVSRDKNDNGIIELNGFFIKKKKGK